jgi:hypothetical protein
MSRPAVFWLFLLTLLSVSACKRDESSDVASPSAEPTATAAVTPPPPAPQNLPASWPTGEAITLALTPAAGATSLTKALYESGDIVLEQIWPDGTQERWWHATDGSTRHVARDGTERTEASP